MLVTKNSHLISENIHDVVRSGRLIDYNTLQNMVN